MRVRKAERADLPHLVRFTAEEAREAEGRTQVLATLERGIGRALEDPTVAQYWMMVDDDDEPVGSVSAVTEWSDWNAGHYWWIQSMYLEPAVRGRGLMRELLAAVEQEMQRQGGLELRLYVHRDNEPAMKAYRKAGFVDAPYRIMTLATDDR